MLTERTRWREDENRPPLRRLRVGRLDRSPVRRGAAVARSFDAARVRPSRLSPGDRLAPRPCGTWALRLDPGSDQRKRSRRGARLREGRRTKRVGGACRRGRRPRDPGIPPQGLRKRPPDRWRAPSPDRRRGHRPRSARAGRQSSEAGPQYHTQGWRFSFGATAAPTKTSCRGAGPTSSASPQQSCHRG